MTWTLLIWKINTANIGTTFVHRIKLNWSYKEWDKFEEKLRLTFVQIFFFFYPNGGRRNVYLLFLIINLMLISWSHNHWRFLILQYYVLSLQGLNNNQINNWYLLKISLYGRFQNLVWSNFTLLKTNTNCVHNISSEIEATSVHSVGSPCGLLTRQLDSIKIKLYFNNCQLVSGTAGPSQWLAGAAGGQLSVWLQTRQVTISGQRKFIKWREHS